MTKKPSSLPDLENSLQEINSIIEKMEQGELNLEQSLSFFERGVMLVTHSQKILGDAEHKVQMLMQNNNNEEKLEPFEIKET